MYTRGYYSEQKEKINIPEGYDGTALLEKETERAPIDDSKNLHALTAEHTKKEIKISPPPIHNQSDCDETPVFKEEPQKRLFGFSGIFDALPLGRLKKLLKREDNGLLPFSFDFEDLLIIGIALFLIFSKTGDRELGFMLIALIFIK